MLSKGCSGYKEPLLLRHLFYFSPLRFQAIWYSFKPRLVGTPKMSNTIIFLHWSKAHTFCLWARSWTQKICLHGPFIYKSEVAPQGNGESLPWRQPKLTCISLVKNFKILTQGNKNKVYKWKVSILFSLICIG